MRERDSVAVAWLGSWTRRRRTDPALPFGDARPIAGLNTDSNDNDPWLSPDGEVIVFASNRSGHHDLYLAICEPPDPGSQ